jgi:flavin-binding protein dodecin
MQPQRVAFQPFWADHRRAKYSREEAMAVVKFIELSGRSSESFEDAVRQTVERASQTIRDIQSVWVKEFEGVVENNRVTQFQVIVKISFLVGEGGSAG